MTIILTTIKKTNLLTLNFYHRTKPTRLFKFLAFSMLCVWTYKSRSLVTLEEAGEAGTDVNNFIATLVLKAVYDFFQAYL